MQKNINTSFVIPLYNESQRVEKLISSIINFCKIKKKYNYEFILIDDGSTDSTMNIIESKLITIKKCRIYGYKKNRGKGYALKYAMKYIKYNWVITMDADLSVTIEYYNKIRNTIISDKKHVIFFGNRNHFKSNVKKKIIRFLLGSILQYFLKVFFKINLKDTQCGYKIYKKDIAKKIFKQITEYGFIHDVEIILICFKNKIKFQDIPVQWKHVKGSKLNIFKDSVIMLFGLLRLRKKYNKLF